MCGRAVQTRTAVEAAASAFGATYRTNSTRQQSQQRGGNGEVGTSNQETVNNTTSEGLHHSQNQQNLKHSKRVYQDLLDNFNLSPGMDATVFWMDQGQIYMDRMAWGLIPKGGTERNPLPQGKSRMSLHFSNLMYNARTDTLFSKPTFSRLASQGKTCVIAFDGYFEWKTSPLGGGKGKKQPYFVYNKKQKKTYECKEKVISEERNCEQQQPYLLLAGLWTQVPTGLPEEPQLNTFTILTTEACESIQWLHHRMPVCIWDIKQAQDWLKTPSQKVLSSLDQTSLKTNSGFDWHMVTTEMSSVKFRDKAAIKALPKPKSVASFFSKGSSHKSKVHMNKKSTIPDGCSSTSVSIKRAADSPPKHTTTKKHKPTHTPKKGTITSFFLPKKNSN